MIEVLFTIDYEMYGNGRGNLKDLVYEPTRLLLDLFNKNGDKLVVFAEVAELKKIAEFGSDPYIGKVEQQIRRLYEQGHEIGLHLHPQWCRALIKDGRWELDYSEYNLCRLKQERISEIIQQAIHYLRSVLDDSEYTPFSFRAGNWLFQPTEAAARSLVEQGLKVDSSVFKGGRQHKYGLDYRRSLENGYWWYFKEEVSVADQAGIMLEIPIYTRMVPFWKMITGKRLGLQKKSDSSRPKPMFVDRAYRLMDRARLLQPLKFDFCRMTLAELTRMIDQVIEADRKTPSLFKPVVAIGHSKDLADMQTIESFMGYLQRNNVKISTFKEVYPKCRFESKKTGFSLE